jgi:hypothetical protein
MTTDRDHTHALGHGPSRRREQFDRPLAALWSVAKGSAQRHGLLHSHEMGFELRIVDERGESVFTQVRGAETEVVMLAARQHDLYRAQGWETFESPIQA